MSDNLKTAMILFDKANEDYGVAKALSNNDGMPFYYSICFHCQQCIEKFLKVFLAYNDIEFPKIHDLGLLLGMCTDVKADFNVFDLSKFARYGVLIRYDDTPLTLEESIEALEMAKAVMDYVKGLIELPAGEVRL